jgi:hypothetical protein
MVGERMEEKTGRMGGFVVLYGIMMNFTGVVK